MKKTLLSMLALGMAFGVGAQVVEVAGLQEVKLAQPLSVDLAKVSPDGSFAIVSCNTSTALHKVDLTTGSSTMITPSGRALELQFTPDSRSVIFKRSVTGPKKLRYHSVESVDLTSGAELQLAKPARHAANYSVTKRGTLTIAGENGAARSMSLHGKKVQETPRAIVGINKGHLEVTDATGTTRFIDPQGRGSYLWPSVSPDGTRIVYYKSGSGCFVCDIDGSNVRPLGYIHAPAWLNDQAVIGCQDYDDGMYVTSSAIVAADMNGTIQTLTDPALLGMGPSASADGKTVTFGTADGKLYVLTLK